MIAMLAAAALLASGCTSDEDEPKPTDSLPDGAGLVEDAAKRAAEITSTHFTVAITGEVPGMAVDALDGDITRDGESVAAKGTAKLAAMGGTAEAKFVLLDGTFHIDLGSGKFQQFPEAQAAMVYDFSAVLDPERGIAKLISGVQDAKTVAEADVNGTPAYQIKGTVGKDAIVGLVPKADADVPVTLWVTKDGQLPVKASAEFPAEEGKDAKPGTMTVTLSKVNEPVTVEPPA